MKFGEYIDYRPEKSLLNFGRLELGLPVRVWVYAPAVHRVAWQRYTFYGVFSSRVFNTPGNHGYPGNLLEFFLLEILEFYWNFARFHGNFMCYGICCD